MGTNTEVVAIEPTVEVQTVSLGVIQASRPAQLVKAATEVADALADVIRTKKLFSDISGKRYVRCEGWTTLAVMLGVTPHEIGVVEAPEGVFTATVELRRLTDGQPVARASAECGAPDEVDRHGKPVWASRPRYARRSMALTRATAKACRLAFSWVMVLAGYEVTPAEEIPHEEVQRGVPGGNPDSHGVEPPEPSGPVMPFGKTKGKLLTQHTSDELLAVKLWCEKKDAAKFATLVEQIDEVLGARGGE